MGNYELPEPAGLGKSEARTFALTWIVDGAVRESIVCSGPKLAGQLKCLQAATAILASFDVESAIELTQLLVETGEFSPSQYEGEMQFYLSESTVIPHDQSWAYRQPRQPGELRRFGATTGRCASKKPNVSNDVGGGVNVSTSDHAG